MSTPQTQFSEQFVLNDVYDSTNKRLNVGVSSSSETAGSFSSGSNRDIDATAEQLTSTSFASTRGVTVVTDATNSGIVYVGKDNTVTAGTDGATDGFPLAAGESLTLEVSNPNLLWVIASVSNQIAYWTAV